MIICVICKVFGSKFCLQWLAVVKCDRSHWLTMSVCGAGAVKFHFNCEKEAETNEISFYDSYCRGYDIAEKNK